MSTEPRRSSKRWDAHRSGVHPKVSVVIPTYNHGHFLGESIQSVLDQTLEDWELIVVDDGSTDNTSEVVDSFNDHRIRYVYQHNRGVAAALNTGIRAARAPYIALLGADDAWLPEKLAMQVAQLNGLPPTVGMVYSDLFMFDQQEGSVTGRFLGGRSPPRGNVFGQLLRRTGAFIHPTTVMFRREVFERAGLFDEDLEAHEDWELWVRIANVYAVDALNFPLARWRSHENNIQKDDERMYRNGIAARLKVLNSYPLDRDSRQDLCHTLASLHYSRALSQLHKGNRPEGWRELRTSLRLHPTLRRYQLHAALLLFAPGLYRFLGAAKRWVTGYETTASSHAIPGGGRS